jgi:membrane-bound metal-dependent hydrolase YbcI (DUF457 family)
MRGSCHVLLHAYYVVLGIALLYGDELLSTYVDQGVAGPLRLLANLELLIFVAVFMDVARAPDCDVACGGTLLGYIAHIPVKPFLRTHRGWYHSVWAAIYMSGVASAVVAALTATVNAVSEHVGFGPVLSLVRLGATAFSASFLSYLLHLAEDSLTLRGVRWLGTRVRGPLRTGGTDIVAASIIVLTSALTTWVAYYATRSLSRGALLGALVLIAMFASMFELASSPPRRT